MLSKSARIITAVALASLLITPCDCKTSKWTYSNPPSLTPGPLPSAYTESTSTAYSITTHLARTLGVIKNVSDYNFKTCDPAVKERLQRIFGTQTVDCRILLKPNGTVSDLTVWKSTASADLEKKACELIRQSSPFEGNKYPSNLRYAISFPNGSDSRLIWWNEQTDVVPTRTDEVHK